MTSENQCQVKDDLANQLIALNNKLNTLSPALLHSEQEREEVQQQRENLNQAPPGERTRRQTLSSRPAFPVSMETNGVNRSEPQGCMEVLAGADTVLRRHDLLTYYFLSGYSPGTSSCGTSCV
jgi:hypothetical protein